MIYSCALVDATARRHRYISIIQYDLASCVVWTFRSLAAIGLNAPRPMSSLSAFEPLVQCRLSSSRHHLPYVLFLHHTFIAHEFFHRSCGNWSHADEDFGSDQMLKGLQLAAASGQNFLTMNVQAKRTVIKTSLLQRIIPILPPPT